MCGIAGVYQQKDAKVSVDLIKKIGLMMNHRGPDNFGCVNGGKVVMTHNRLSLLDLSNAANQPYRNDRYSLVYNGEIYNFKQIRRRLENEYKVEFKTTSDTEVLFYSLIHDGIHECLRGLRGMFAFAFYDRNGDELWLARDRMGIKPLYYYQDADNFYWASEIKALAKSLALPLDCARTLLSINNNAEKSIEYTLFKGVRSVKPGCYVKIDARHRMQEFVYYDVLDDIDKDYYEDLDKQPTASVLSTFETLFTKSVEDMLVSDAPVGAFVSGGVDSSLISAIAAERAADAKLFTANVVGKYSEFSDAQLLSKHINKKIYDYKFKPEMLLRDWADVTYFYECPIVIHVNSIPFSNVARLAHDYGVKAVLTGEGADELFLGYPRLLTKRYQDVLSFPINVLKSLYKFVPDLHDYLFPETKRMPLFFINNLIQGFESERLEEETNEKLNFLSDAMREEQYLTIGMLRGHLTTLLYRNDRMGMMSSIEARFPFLDEDIIKFAINLPAKYKIGRSSRFHNYKHPFLIDKWIVRKMAEKYLPMQIAMKKKNGFPMFGHKFVRIKNGFFENGWFAENLGLNNDTQNFFLKSQDPYFIAKLASVEIFGRIFDLGQSPETVKNHVLKFAEVINQ
jgi:asparagine synthase (glutamine-hydrolysing)